MRGLKQRKMKKLLTALLILFTTQIIYGQSTNSKYQTDSTIVYVSFTVETSGKIGTVKLKKIKCKGCSKEYKKNISNEAIRVIKEMPDWKEHTLRTKYILPIKFKFDN